LCAATSLVEDLLQREPSRCHTRGLPQEYPKCEVSSIGHDMVFMLTWLELPCCWTGRPPPREDNVSYKGDGSPLTAADIASNSIICERLQQLNPHVPIISEENKIVPYSVRKKYQFCWMVGEAAGAGGGGGDTSGSYIHSRGCGKAAGYWYWLQCHVVQQFGCGWCLLVCTQRHADEQVEPWQAALFHARSSRP
jgi:hypothetical protein